MEDFGYQKDETKSKFSELTKRGFLVGATLFSIACFIYITVNAYYFVYEDKESDIEIIKAEEGPIKVLEEGANETDSMQIDRSIYEDIFGNQKVKKEVVNAKIRNAPTPALPPKSAEIDRRLIREQTPPTLISSDSKKPEIARSNKEEKIIVYSNAKSEGPSKDLLTKTDGKEREVTEKSMEKPPVKSQKRAVRVQVAAMTSKSAADDSWNRLNRLYPSLFSGLKSFTEEVNLGKRGIFYRLQIGNFYNQIEAEEFCNKYVAQAQKSRADCIIVE